MTGYVATGRIVRAHPRFVGSSASRARADGQITPADVPLRAGSRSRPLDVRIAEGWAQAREEWAQATFFLFDPNSWR